MFIGSLLLAALAISVCIASASTAATAIADRAGHQAGVTTVTQKFSVDRVRFANALLWSDGDHDDHGWNHDHDGFDNDSDRDHRPPHREPRAPSPVPEPRAPSPVPEPGTAILAGVALLIGGGALRLRRTSKKA
jgi:hypothetical protein